MFYETERVLSNLAASQPEAFGDRPVLHTVYGGGGEVVGEYDFDFAEHDVNDIVPFSLEEEVTGHTQVAEVIPERALDVRVIMHLDPEESSRDPQEIVLARKSLIASVHNGIRRSLLFGDTPGLFTVGKHVVGAREPAISGFEGEHVRGTESPELAAEVVEELCALDGLAIVISTFKNLPLGQLASSGIRGGVVGVKANHHWDRAIQPNTGSWDTDEPTMPVVKTKDGFRGRESADIAPYRRLQQQCHEETVARLEAAGLSMAEAVFDNTAHPTAPYFDVRAVDRSIAGAIERSVR